MKIRPLLTVIALTLIGLLIHKAVFYLWIPKAYEDHFLYSIPKLYLFFGLFSLVLIFILNEIKKRSIDNVGYTFLLLTCFKMVLAYALLKPILETALAQTPTEKMNFFTIFIYFLAIETIVTIRILNNKQ